MLDVVVRRAIFLLLLLLLTDTQCDIYYWIRHIKWWLRKRPLGYLIVFYCCGCSFTEPISWKQGQDGKMRRVRVDNDRSDMNSGQVVKSQALLDSGCIRKHFREDPAWLRFQFSFPRPWLFFWIPPHQNCTQTSRHHGNPRGLWFAFLDLWESCLKIPRSNAISQHWAVSLAPYRKKIITQTKVIICWNERCKAEYWI